MTILFVLVWILVGVLGARAAWQFRMAVSPGRVEGAVPTVDGRALLVPSTTVAFGVALVRAACAGVVGATAGLVAVDVPPRVLEGLCGLLALALAARAIGEFRYVGFFKRVRGGRFAHLDTLVSSPLCLVLAIGVATIAVQGGAR